jgi:hypothetical protein
MSITIQNTTLEGQAIQEFFPEAVSSATFVQTTGAQVVPTNDPTPVWQVIKKPTTVIRKYTSDFTPAGSNEVENRSVDLCQLRMDERYENKVFVNDIMQLYYQNDAFREQAFDDNLVADIVLDIVQRKLSLEVSTMLLYGEENVGSGNLGLCDGFKKTYLDLSGSNEIVADPSAIDVTDPSATDNVATEMSKLIEEAQGGVNPYKLSRSQNQFRPRYYVSPYIMDRYTRFQQANTQNSPIDITQDGINTFRGYEVKVLLELDDYEMFFGDLNANLRIFTDDGTNGWSSLQIRNQYPMTNDDHTRVSAMWRMAIGIGNENEMVWYTN